MIFYLKNGIIYENGEKQNPIHINEIFDLMKQNSIKLNIEIKNGPIFYEGIELAVIKLINEYKYENRILIASFNHYALKKVKEINADISTALLYQSYIYEIENYIEKLELSAVHPHYYYVRPELVDKMHDIGIAVNTWIINDPEQFKEYSQMGIDCIGTNYPDRMLFEKA